jgi:HEAT repeat protein
MLINGLGALDGADAPGVTAFLIERLAGDTAEGVRIGAAMALGGRIAEPGVRAALERAQATDASLAVRDLTGRALRGEAVPGLRWSAAAVSTD